MVKECCSCDWSQRVSEGTDRVRKFDAYRDATQPSDKKGLSTESKTGKKKAKGWQNG